MQKRAVSFPSLVFVVMTLVANSSVAAPIDRHALVARHSPTITQVDPASPFMVGNGSIGFTADITGLQTFQDRYSPLVPLMTEAQWGWHSFPNPQGYTLDDALVDVKVRDGTRKYPFLKDWSSAQGGAIKWLRENPHRFNLGRLGLYLGVAGATIGAADALYAGLADHYVPVAELPALEAVLSSNGGAGLPGAIAAFAAPFKAAVGPSALERDRAAIDHHFGAGSVPAIVASLQADDSDFARATLAMMATRSPLMMCVAYALQEQGAAMSMADCLRMERAAVRRTLENGQVIEGIRALVIDKDHAPRWEPAALADVTEAMVRQILAPAWPDHAHPLRHFHGAA